jgi:predicted  nucleic acid-binding Zn-ribbon protein
MIKLYKKKFITNSSVKYAYKYEFEAYLPKVIKTGYKKYYKGVWEATVLVKRDETNEKVLNNLKDYLFQIYDKNGEYIGAFIPNKPDEAILNKQSTITINCNHALITLLDSIFPEDIETDSEDVNSLFSRVLSHQKQRIWEYRESAHASEATDIKLEKQNGLLNPFLKIAGQLSPLYYFSYDTEGEFPWTISLNRVTDTPTARIREGYNLLDYKLTSDPSNIYNRLYVYGEVEELTNAVLNDRVDAKEIQKENEAWRKYQSDYAAWKNEQIKMQKKRDLVLKRREELVNSGASPSELPKLPPRPSTIAPPQKPSISSRKMKRSRVAITTANPAVQEYLEDVDSIKTYGLKERILEFKDISDPTLLYNMAKKIFENRTNEVYDYSINAADLNKLLVKPIPFDWIRLGTTISFQTYRAGKAIEDDLVIVEESKQDIDGAPEKIEITLQLKNSASAPVVSNSTASQLLSKIEETEADIIKAYRSADGKNTIYSGKDQPPNPKVNDIWYKQTLDDQGKPTIEMWIFNGDIWINPFADLDQIDEAIARNEKELDALLKEAQANMTNIEKDIEKNSEDINKRVKDLDDQVAAKITEIEKSLDDAATKVDQAVKDATDLLQGNINELEKKMQDDVDKRMSEAQTELLAKATELVNGVQTKVDEKIGLLQKTIAQTAETTDGLKQKVTEFEESINGLTVRMAESEKTANSAKTAVSEIQNTVNSLSSTFQTLQETNKSLTKRVSAVEQDATGLRTLIESTEKNLGDKISNLNTRVETAEGNYTTLTKTVNDVTEKANKISSTVDKNTAIIAQQTKDISATSEKITNLSTTVTQTNDKVETIITDYAKKSDLSGLATKEFTTTQIEAKAGELSTVISSQKEEIDNTIAGIKARPTYTIGKDGYWYKDGKKTSTMAIGADGESYKWNLIDDGSKLLSEKDYVRYFFNQEVTEGTVISISLSYKGWYDNISFMYTIGNGSGWMPSEFKMHVPSPSESSAHICTVTAKVENTFKKGDYIILRPSTYKTSNNDNIKTYYVYWFSVVMGDKPVKDFVPSRNDLKGKDGKDAHLYTGTTPPSDTKQMWFNPNDMTTYVYINGKWVDMNKTTKDQVVAYTKTINELKVTDTQIMSDISQIKSANNATNTKLNTLDRDLSSTKSTVSEIDKKVKDTQEQVSKNTTQISQTNSQISTIISSYAKKTDLSGFVSENRVNTIVDQKAGAIKTSLSSEITTIDNKVNGLKARPTYTIGDDGYWYKDGKKTDTLAKGVSGKDGGEFGWNLLLDGDTKVTNNNEYMVHNYNLAESIPEGTLVSFVIRCKGKRDTNRIVICNSGTTYGALKTIYLPNNSDAGFKTYVVTDKWSIGKSDNNSLWLIFGKFIEPFNPISIEWVKLVYGDKPTMEFAPAKSEIYGKDGKDANVYRGSAPPKDTSLLWLDTRDNTVNVFYDGYWRDINSTVLTKINTVSDTVDSHKRTIAEYKTDFNIINNNMDGIYTRMNSFEQNLDGFKLTVQNKNYLSIINQQAGRQVFQVTNGSTTGKLAITPETVYIKDATIQSSHISSLSASKLTAGTINCNEINVINMNAGNISTGTLSGYRGYWNLNNGEFYNGYSSSSIRLSNGVAKFSDSIGEGVVIESGRLTLSTNITSSSSYTKVGELCGGSKWNGTDDIKNVRLAHHKGSTMTLSYYDLNYNLYHPYIIFDYYRVYHFYVDHDSSITDFTPISVMEPTMFKDNIILSSNSCINFPAGMVIARCIVYTNDGESTGIFIGRGTSGMYITDNRMFMMNGSSYEIIYGDNFTVKNVSVFNK